MKLTEKLCDRMVSTEITMYCKAIVAIAVISVKPILSNSFRDRMKKMDNVMLTPTLKA